MEEGLVSAPVHSGCSRQSILYVRNILMAEKKTKAKPMYKGLLGAQECRFRVTMESMGPRRLFTAVK